MGSSMKYAVTHPGKIGDALYALPTIRYLYEISGNKVDFYTSDYCRPMKELFEYQSCVGRFIVSEGYVVERMDMGCQPIYLPVPNGEYDTVFHLGFRGIPDTRLDHFMSLSVGIDPSNLKPIQYEVPEYKSSNSTFLLDFLAEKKSGYYVLGTRGITTYDDTFKRFVEIADKPVVIVGSSHEYNGYGFNYTGLDLLKTAYIMSKSSGYVGLMSSMLVLANGFNMKKVIPHDGRSWDMRHVVYSDRHEYLVSPTAENILESILR